MCIKERENELRVKRAKLKAISKKIDKIERGICLYNRAKYRSLINEYYMTLKQIESLEKEI